MRSPLQSLRQRLALRIAPWLTVPAHVAARVPVPAPPTARRIVPLEPGMDKCAYTGLPCRHCGGTESCTGKMIGWVSRHQIREAHHNPTIRLHSSY